MGKRSIAFLVTPSKVEGSGIEREARFFRGQMSRSGGLLDGLDMTDAVRHGCSLGPAGIGVLIRHRVPQKPMPRIEYRGSSIEPSR